MQDEKQDAAPAKMTLAQAAEDVQNCVRRMQACQTELDNAKVIMGQAVSAVTEARAKYREIEREMRDVLGPKPRARKAQ